MTSCGESVRDYLDVFAKVLVVFFVSTAGRMMPIRECLIVFLFLALVYALALCVVFSLSRLLSRNSGAAGSKVKARVRPECAVHSPHQRLLGVECAALHEVEGAYHDGEQCVGPCDHVQVLVQ
jgi:hypothetical protein